MDRAVDEQVRWWRLPKWQAFLAIAVSFATIVMSTSMVFVMLPAIADEFEVTLGAVGWVVIIESLVVSSLLLPLGGLADSIGRRRMYLTGLSIFAVGSVLTGLSPTFVALIAARIIMSLGNALFQSVATGMLAAAFPANEKGLVMGAQTTAVAVGAASGPLVAGFALQVTGWQTLFFMVAIAGGLSIVAGLTVLESDRPDGAKAARSFDGFGGVLAGTGVVALVFTISNPLGLAWLSAPTIAAAAASIVLFVGFCYWELGHPNPMIELRLFNNPVFRAAVLTRLLAFIAVTTTTLLLPIYLVSLRGLANRTAGLIIFCTAVGIAVGAQISGRLSDRVGPGPPSLVGLVVQTIVTISIAFADRQTPLPMLVVAMIVAGLAMSLWNVPNNGTMMASVPPKNFAVVGAFTNVTRTIGNVLGQALATAIVVAVMTGQGFDVPLGDVATTPGAGDAFLDGWRVAYVVTAVISALTLLVAKNLPFSPVRAPDEPDENTTSM